MSSSYNDFDREDEVRQEIERLYDEIYDLKRSMNGRSTTSRRARLYDYEDSYRDSRANKEMMSLVSKRLDNISDKLDTIDSKKDPLEKKIDDIEDRLRSIQSSLDYQVPFKNHMEKVSDDLNKNLDARFGNKTFSELWGKLSAMSAIVMANLVGTVMLLVLICYFIFNLG